MVAKNIQSLWVGNTYNTNNAVHIGMIVPFAPNTADDFSKAYVRILGQELSRTTYSGLWKWVQETQGDQLVDDATWQAAKSTSYNGSVAVFSTGDGVSTFRMIDEGDGGFDRSTGNVTDPVLLNVGFQDQIVNFTGGFTAPTPLNGGAGTWGTLSEVTSENTVYGSTVVISGSREGGAVGVKSEIAINASRQVNTGSEVQPKGQYRKYFMYTGAEVTKPVSSPTVDQLITMASAKNVLINTCFDADTVVNQREFDGDWSTLSVGDYGYDMWFKYSDTQIAQIVEAGTYKKGVVHTITANGVVLGKITSPSSGHWEIVLPNTVNYVDLYAGDFTREWQPESGLDDECLSRFKISGWYNRGDYGVAGRLIRTLEQTSEYRRTPTIKDVSFSSSSPGFLALNPTILVDRETGVIHTYTDYTASTLFDGDVYAKAVYTADATLTSADASQTDIVGV